MRVIINYVAKFFILLFAAGTITTISVTNLYAQDNNIVLFLQQIANSTAITSTNTANIYNTLNKTILNYLKIIAKVALSWGTDEVMDPDGKHPSFITNSQLDFASLGVLLAQNDINQSTNDASKSTFSPPISVQLAAALFLQPVANLISKNNQSPEILKILPNINDLLYPTILGLTPVAKAPASALNYLTNAAGLSISHVMPPNPINIWGDPQSNSAVQRYIDLYNTVSAVGSFNTFALSNLAIDTNKTNVIQDSLIMKASNSAWLLQIATEELGKVLRQILLFESQNYVVSTELLKLQRQLLTAQVMTNTLLVLNNQMNEYVIYSKASGTPMT